VARHDALLGAAMCSGGPLQGGGLTMHFVEELLHPHKPVPSLIELMNHPSSAGGTIVHALARAPGEMSGI
jgi:hypothetical protein